MDSDADAFFSAHPTSFLPSLVRLSTHSTQEVASAVDRLHNLYWPPKSKPALSIPASITLPHRTVRIHDDSVPDSGYASAEEEGEGEDTITPESEATDAEMDRDGLEVVRADPLQREFAIKWTTGFIARCGAWIDDAAASALGPEEYAARMAVLDDVTALLAAFVGGHDHDSSHDHDGKEEDASTTMTRTFTFKTPREGGGDGEVVTVRLNDEPLLEDDHTSVGLQSWGSCIRLGERICADPAAFSLVPSTTRPRPLRVLELGAGTGLLSILAAKLLASSLHTPRPVVVATDYHPDVLANLSANVAANFPASSSSPSIYPSGSSGAYTPAPAPAPVHVHALDWETPVYTPGLLDAPFDVVLAADVVYHPQHARWIRGCVERLLRRPGLDSDEDEDEGGVFWMIIAVRPIGRHAGLDGSVSEVFGEGEEAGWDGRESGGWAFWRWRKRGRWRVWGGWMRVGISCLRLGGSGWRPREPEHDFTLNLSYL
ncbi:putative lysine methyltransferase [Lyophyllum shimeji]|uniref:Lysine methyltransferase n=1 Tax=Lyophyllum shimeji TaxID=47721 RepID=A0A9P3USJ7_LYOSH|nr:putative lysine methyltransferase [Lyophyllum shimeji]